MDTVPLVLLTCGDPAGIGPELVIKALRDENLRKAAAYLLVGPELVWKRAAGVYGLEPDAFPPVATDAPRSREAGSVSLQPVRLPGLPELDAARDIPFGKPSELSGQVAFSSLEAAAEILLAGKADALMTAPLSKHAVSLTQPCFVGHTGYLGDVCGAVPLMMLEGGGLKTALVTDHVPLSRVPEIITKNLVLDTIRRLAGGLRRDYAISSPRIVVCGLNPHAGEDGLLGSEELEKIAPAVETARAEGILATGPMPGDTAPAEMLSGHFDAVLAMYHDQGLAPMKAVGFSEGVNVTLGLSVVRTSPDHGTAFSLAGTGKANPTPTINAIQRAVAIFHNRRQGQD